MAEAAREEFLAQRSGHDYLFALSLGGMIGLEWMRRWPEDFCGVVLVNTSVRGLSPLSDRLRPVNYIRILRMLLSRDQGAVEQNILEMTSSKSKDFSHLAREWVKIAKAHPVNSANALRQLVAAARFRPGQERPTLPTLVLNGAQDRLVNPACSAALAKAWGLRLEVHPTAGHDLTLDEPEWVLAELAKFTGIVAR
jgi:pimeloyl-ACP methyl ester carboxylesterase